MSDFDNYIKEKYPQDYENLKLNYPDVEPSEFYPEAIDAWNHQQQKIDEYAMVAEALDESYVRECKKNKELQNKIKELELINFDSELHFEAAKEKIDELQKRIDDVVIECDDWYRLSQNALAVKVKKMLKGETHES